MDDKCDNKNINEWGVVLVLAIILLLITVGLICLWIEVDE